ncbi:MAG: hypothetical protein IPH18_14800 [Chitinophagaceae bacterium]|nr:hypothetical protein [Chitinophagaceae bacterium]
MEKLKAEFAATQNRLKEAKMAISKYYDENWLKEKYYERTDKSLIDLFTSGIFSSWKCEDVLLRKIEKRKILDHFRQTVKWD